MQLILEHDDFRRLWLAQTISQICSQISYLAIPLRRDPPAALGMTWVG
jgi:hypothetical protein